jgi:hypothetical protein
MNDTTDTASEGPAPTVQLYVLLDRSGSMASIHTETVAGFNAFLAGQQINGADARLTLVQFDDQNPADIVIDDLPIRRVRPLRRHDFRPRGATPLLDATASLIARAQARGDVGAKGAEKAAVVVVTITDGHENASKEFSREALRALVAEREADGWVFVFLSAGLDAYTEARSFGYADGSVQSWSPDGGGAQLAFGSLDVAVSAMRVKYRQNAPIDPRDAFAGQKPAEADRRHKRGDTR